jgi:hypothetical protein
LEASRFRHGSNFVISVHFRRIVELICSKLGCWKLPLPGRSHSSESAPISSTGSIVAGATASLGFRLIVPPAGESVSNAESLVSLPLLDLLNKDSERDIETDTDVSPELLHRTSLLAFREKMILFKECV